MPRRPVTIPPSKLKDLIFATPLHEPVDREPLPAPLWDIVLSRRLASLAAEEGSWLVDKTKNCVAQVIPDESTLGRGRINLFHRGMTKEHLVRDIIQVVLRDAIQILFEVNAVRDVETADKASDYRIILTFGALDRNLLPHVRSTLGLHEVEEGCSNILATQHKFRATFLSQCGMWIHETTSGDSIDRIPTFDELNEDFPSGVTLRPLKQSDADLIDSHWEYSSDNSLSMIRKMIAASEKTYGGCVGLEVDNKLVSWVCRYLDGTLGMLWTEDGYRKKGYAASVLMTAVCDIRRRCRLHRGGDVCHAEERMVSYIVDSNIASQGLYKKLGWVRAADADWAGFASRKICQSEHTNQMPTRIDDK